MLTAIWAVLIFCFFIFIHEFGHFIIAKLSGMTVHEFSVGMGPRLIGFGKKTAYSLRLLPIGGYVKLEGEDGESDDPDAFCNKSAIKRFAVLFAGSFMNIITGFLIFVIVFSLSGSLDSNRIDSIIEGSAFHDAGILPGDKIVRMEGEDYSSNIHTYRDIIMFTSFNGENDAIITFEREEERFKKEITPSYIEGEEQILFGFSSSRDSKSPFNILYHSFWQCIFVIKSVFLSIWWLICGIVPVSSVGGPVAIVQEIGNAAKYGITNVLFFAGFISVNLGVMNLLPIPALDGGRIVFLFIEKIRGKKIKPELEGFVNFVFFALLMLLMLVVTFSDISKIL